VYASPTGADQSGCGTSIGNPCTFVRAKQEITPARNTIKLLAGSYSLGGGDGDITQNTVLAAREATITRSNNGPILTVKNGSRFEIVGGTLTNATGNGGDAIKCESGGTVAATSTTFDNNSESGVDTDTCKLAIARSIFTRNFRGAVTMGGDPAVVTFTSNLAHHNGTTSTNAIGGIRVQPATGSKIDFNTIVDNLADRGASSAGGVICTGPLEARYNIIYRNMGGPTPSEVQILGDCNFSTSFVEAQGTPDNKPGFISPDTSPYDYHLSASSPAEFVDAAGACTGFDLDGRKRPVGGACDLGAYERFP
ncbi:MAG: choice-of-anchor Q domain-containing protein, partial [Kofleriaceae bacterium]